MIVLQSLYRNVFFLFLFLYMPGCIYSENGLQFFDYPSHSNELVKHEATQQNVIGMSNFVDRKLHKKNKKLSYYLYIQDFIKSFIEIPTTNVFIDSSTISSKYLAGRAPIYNRANERVGTCSASFLCMQNTDGIYTDISNYLSIDNGLIVTWFTPTTLINLELDSILHSMVTECIVIASTKVGFNPFYGKKFNMVVSSDNEKIYFELS